MGEATFTMVAASFKSIMRTSSFPTRLKTIYLTAAKEGCRESTELQVMLKTLGDCHYSSQNYLSHKETTHYNSIIDNFNLHI